MAEQITLNAYIERIENMLRQGRMDEAIAHSAHVLQFYPKNAAIYRNMGRALMRLQRHEEAGEIFRRLLAAIPDDFSAHYQLSIIYESEDNSDAALWHIERAFDQQPSNTQVNDRLRELYQKYRQIEVDKIQLTTGAVANQYVKAGMYPEALALLERTLAKVPDRIDLRLIAVRALWAQDERIEAAETSLDILKTYPYALEANRIMTELWLSEDRPSDAQRYLSRMDQIDPFIAYEIATGEAVDHSRFKVEELDFAVYAASMASQEDAPAWLENIEQLAESEQVAVIADPIDDLDFDEPEAIAETADDDWLSDFVEEAEDALPVAAKKVTDDLSDLLPDDFVFPESAGTDDTVAESEISDFDLFAENDADDDFFADMNSESRGVTDLLGDYEDDSDAGDGTGLTGLLGEDDYGSPAAQAENLDGLLGALSGNNRGETDDLSWLDDVASGDYEANQAIEDDLFAEEKTPQSLADKPDIDPLAWLNEDALLDTDDSQEFDEFSTDDLVEANSPNNPDDPMAWLQDTGIDFDENADVVSPLFAVDDDPVTLESNEVDPMAWLGADNVLDDDDVVPPPASSMTAQFDQSEIESDMLPPTGGMTAQFDQSEIEDDIDDPLSWLAEAGVDIENNGEFEAGDNADFNDPHSDDSMAWLDDSGIEITEDDEFVASETSDLLTDQLVNLDDATDTEGDPMEWLAEDGVEFLGDDEVLDDDDWFSDDSVLDDLLNIADLTNTSDAEPIEDFDLLTDTEMQDTMTEQPDSQDNDNFDWLDNPDDSEDIFNDASQDDDSMAWLSEAGVDIDDNDTGQEDFDLAREDDSMAWLSEAGVDIDDNEPEDSFEVQRENDDSMAWLSEAGIDLEDNDDDFMATNDLGLDDEHEELNWVEDDATENEELSVEEPTSMLSFLNSDHEDIELPNVADISETDAFDDESDWLRVLDGEEPAPSAPHVAPESYTDDFQDVDVNTDDLDWGNDDDEEKSFLWDLDDNEEAEEDDAELDWMSGDFAEEDDAQPAEADWLADLDAPDNTDGFDDFADEDAQPAEADWLADLDAPDDSDDFADFADEDAAPAEADWLADLDATDDSDDFTEEDAEPAEADWLADLDAPDNADDFADFAEEDAQPAEADWLADLDATDDSDDFADEDAAPAEADWLADLDATDDSDDFAEEDAAPAEADWLADLDTPDNTDGFDDFADEDPEPAEADWLAEVGDGFTDELQDAEPALESEWGELGDGFTDELNAENADWLTENTDPDAVAAEIDLSDISEEDFDEPEGADWLGDLDDEAIQADVSDEWGVIGAGFTDELNEETSEETDDWGDVGDAFTDELHESEEILESDPEPVAEADDNWLNDIGVGEEDEWVSEDEDDYDEYAEYEGDDLNIETTGMTDMLNSIRVSDDELLAETSDDDSLDDLGMPEWLQDVDNNEIESDSDDAGEWSEELEGFEEESSEFAFQEVYDEADAEPAEADWLADLDGDDDADGDFAEELEEEALPLAEADEFEETDEIDFAEPVFEASGFEEDYDEETEQIAADNAPDWLNAMVPGLDLDFEAEDEGHLDEGFEERDNTLRERRINESETINSDFEWLQDIVEEESGMMEVVDEDDVSTPPPPISMPPRRVYEFSAPPVWARGSAIKNIAESDLATDDVPDYLSDFEDFEDVQDFDPDMNFDDQFEFETDEVTTLDSEFNLEDDQATTPNPNIEVAEAEFNFEDGGIEINNELDDKFAGDFDDFEDAFDDEFEDFEFDDDFDE